MERLAIDEAIAHAREVAAIQRNNDKLNKTLGMNSQYYQTDCLKCAEEHEQLAEWLEELKVYREAERTLDESYDNGYNKAIDDFVVKLHSSTEEYEVMNAFGDIVDRVDAIEINEVIQIAEQLKEGVENE